MTEYSKLSHEELTALDSLIEKVKADATFITAIVPVVARVVPVVVRATPVVARVTPAIVGEAVRAQAAPHVKGALPGSLSADDLIALRKSLSE